MKYCMSGRQPAVVLQKADEIKIELRDFRALPEYIEKYSNKILILEMTNDIPVDFSWDEIAVYAEKMNGNFYCALSDLNTVQECKSRDIKFYYKYQVTSFYELVGLKFLGVSYILIGIPLIFDLKRVASYGVPIRAIPNLAYEPYIKHENGICGGWIRPEDTEKYERYIDVFEFFAKNSLEKENALFRIYAEQKIWPGNLNFLIDHLDFDFNNQLLYDEENFALRRMNCQQKCMYGKPCHYCTDQLKFESILKKYQSQKSGIDFS